MLYRYWIIRFVPNVARGEFTNIGIVCGRDGGDWHARFETRGARATGVTQADLQTVGPWLRWFQHNIENGVSDLDATTSEWLEQLRVRQANTLQLAQPLPIDVTSAVEGVDLLFPHLVERADTRVRDSPTRPQIRRRLKDALVARRGYTLNRDLFQSPETRIGRQRVNFDLLRESAQGNILTDVWSFNVKNFDRLEQEIRSSNFMISTLRDHGASFEVQPEKFEPVGPESLIEVIYDPPKSESPQAVDVFEAAREAWASQGVEMLTLSATNAQLARPNEYPGSSLTLEASRTWDSNVLQRVDGPRALQ
uniref:DUF3037 domain-containing protein n=1 Tax=Pseudoclavibacter sp. RFBI5 TaxID=2080578 RepID=UPI0015E33E66|nr:DUF3037 domain-containing protein [Pseudoclavibacter sp. RFBI5]